VLAEIVDGTDSSLIFGELDRVLQQQPRTLGEVKQELSPPREKNAVMDVRTAKFRTTQGTKPARLFQPAKNRWGGLVQRWAAAEDQIPIERDFKLGRSPLQQLLGCLVEEAETGRPPEPGPGPGPERRPIALIPLMRDVHEYYSQGFDVRLAAELEAVDIHAVPGRPGELEGETQIVNYGLRGRRPTIENGLRELSEAIEIRRVRARQLAAAELIPIFVPTP
jgi:hypothetical protein